MRTAAVVLAIVVAAVLLSAVAVPRFVPMESFRPAIEAAIADRTGRAATFSRISLALLPVPAVRMSGFSISGPATAPAESLVSAPVAEFRLSFLPFLSGRNEFTTLLLRHPKITVRKYPGGTHTAADVLARLAGTGPPSSAGDESWTLVTLKGIRVQEGTLSILGEGNDTAAGRPEQVPVSFRVSGIGAKEKPFSLEVGLPAPVRGTLQFEGVAAQRAGDAGGGLSLRGEGKAFGQKFTTDGTLSAPGGIVAADLSVSFPKVDLGKLADGFPGHADFLSRLRPEGTANVTASLSGDTESLGFEAKADLQKAGWTVVEGISKFIDVPCTLLVEGHRFPERLVVSNAELRFPHLLLIGNASLSPETGAREYSASGRIASLAEFARNRGDRIAKWSPEGRIALSLTGKSAGGAAPDLYRVEADLAGAAIRVPGGGTGVSDVGGHVTVTPESVDFSPLAGLVGGQRFLLRGKISRGDVPTGEVDLRMGYLDLTALLPETKTDEKKNPRDGEDFSSRLAEAWNREMAFTARVSIDAVDLWGIECTRLTGIFRNEKGALSFDGVRAELYGGELALSGALTGPGIDPGVKVRVGMKEVKCGDILRLKSSLRDFISGKFSLSADLAGSRKDLASFLRTVTGSGSLRIADGKMNGVDYLALSAAAAGGGTGSAPGDARGDTPFREIDCRFTLRGGKAHLADLRIDSGPMALSGDATIGLADHTLEMLGTLRLSGDLSKTPPWSGGGFPSGRTGETVVPLVVSGRLRSPAVAIDTTRAGQATGRMLREAVPEGRYR